MRTGEVSPTTATTDNYDQACFGSRAHKTWGLAHPGTRIDVEHCALDEENSTMAVQEYHAFMWASYSDDVVLRNEGSKGSISSVDMEIEGGAGSPGQMEKDAIYSDIHAESVLQQANDYLSANNPEQEPDEGAGLSCFHSSPSLIIIHSRTSRDLTAASPA